MCYKAFVVEDNCWNSNKCIFTLLTNTKSPQNTENLIHLCRREFNHHLQCRNKGLKLYCSSDLGVLALMRRTKHKSSLTQLWSTVYEDHVSTFQTGFKLIQTRFHYFLPNCKSFAVFHRTLQVWAKAGQCINTSGGERTPELEAPPTKTTSYCKPVWESQQCALNCMGKDIIRAVYLLTFNRNALYAYLPLPSYLYKRNRSGSMRLKWT